MRNNMQSRFVRSRLVTIKTKFADMVLQICFKEWQALNSLLPLKHKKFCNPHQKKQFGIITRNIAMLQKKDWQLTHFFCHK